MATTPAAGNLDSELDYILKSNAAVQIGYDRDSLDDYEKLIPAIKQLFASYVIGEDEKHDNGQVMVNDPSTCMDCTNPDERFARNQFRAKQRQLLEGKD